MVSAIDWLPGYGNVIIVSHKEDYRTVYGHLSEIYVAEGDRVKGGTVLAKVDETIEGKILHFEIWQSRDKQNPELWFAKK
jgi:murein DD-endopeptidase MepM/ murein hydrolase activator NlpD